MAGESENLIESIMGILGENPEEKIAELLKGINTEDLKASATEKEESDAMPDISSLMNLGKMLSPGSADDDNTRLLVAIKPFLNDKRKPQVDSLLKILKLKNMAEKAGGMDFLKNLKL